MAQPPLKRPLPKTTQSGNAKDVLGRWETGRFTFDSPEAETAWHQRAYAQGIHPRDWHRGRELDEGTAKLVEGGLAGATPPFYRGPDGAPRFGNQHTIEPPAQRELRQRSFAGKTLDQIAAIQRSTGKFPGEDEAAALTPRNDNQSSPDRPGPATIASHSEAILAGMQHARETAPIILAKTAQATIPGKAPPPANDATPEPLLPTSDGHGRMPKGPESASPQRDYARNPEPVPNGLAIGQPTPGKANWPVIEQDWVTTDQRGNSVLTEKASQELDRYKETVRAEAAKYTAYTNEMAPGLQADAGAFMRHYLDGSGAALKLTPTPELLDGVNVKSANDDLNTHVLEWLTNPNKTKHASEQVVAKIQSLTDGQSVTVSSTWDGATDWTGASMSAFSSPAYFGALGHVQIHGVAEATVTRNGDRYFATVKVTKELRDIHDFTDNDGEDLTNAGIFLANNMPGSNARPPLQYVDLAMLSLLAATGRAKPFNIRSTPWADTFTVELRRPPTKGRTIALRPLEIVPGSGKWERGMLPASKTTKPGQREP
ncbi:hypothetical protein [Dongia sp.]|uniref:hypothetical protein n=1 Tax=Dongia sp. TaxID=1977262 RepID=UPI0035B02121